MKISAAFTFLILLCCALLSPATVAAAVLPGPLVSGEWLAENLDAVVILDVRKPNKAVNGVSEPHEGFIPGAVLVPFDKVTIKRVQDGVQLQGMTLDGESFAGLMADSGVANGDSVVITGPGKFMNEMAYAARLYWTMRYHGHATVAILDGGNALWRKEGRGLIASAATPQSASYRVTGSVPGILAEVADVKMVAVGHGGQLFDARGPGYYSGEKLYKRVVPPQGRGHIVGASNLPLAELVQGNGDVVRVRDLVDIDEMAQMMDMDLHACINGAASTCRCRPGGREGECGEQK